MKRNRGEKVEENTDFVTRLFNKYKDKKQMKNTYNSGKKQSFVDSLVRKYKSK